MVKKMRKIWFFGFILLMNLPLSSEGYSWDGIVILGDSLSTGAASHPDLTYDSQSLWSVVNGEKVMTAERKFLSQEFKDKILEDTLVAPVRLWPSRRENDGASQWLWLHMIQALSRSALDTEQFSYGYLFARGMGIEASKIWIGGDNGTRSDSSVKHIDRMLVKGQGRIPTKVMLLYTGNDLCAQTWDLTTPPEIYGQELYKGLEYLALRGRNDENESSTILIPAFLPLSTLLHRESILKKEINFYGAKSTCQEARKNLFSRSVESEMQASGEQNSMKWMFSKVMPPNPVALCPSVFSPTNDPNERIGQVANRVRAYRDQQEMIVKKFNDNAAAGKFPNVRISARYLNRTSEVIIEGVDVSDDCFHLSLKGHEKVAKTLMDEFTSK